MAVFTPVTFEQARDYFALYDLPDQDLADLTPIAEGTDNSNFLLTGTDHKYVLTLFESRVNPEDLPGIFQFIAELEQAGIPVAHPYHQKDGHQIGELNGRPAVLFSFLHGEMHTPPAATHAGQAGELLAQMHNAAEGMDIVLPKNPLSLATWKDMAKAHRQTIAEFDQWENVQAALSVLSEHWPTLQNLPMGNVHADVFPDNVFFNDGQIAGVIDFYFSCMDSFAYDMMLTLNAWCFDTAGTVGPDYINRFLKGYIKQRLLTEDEVENLSLLGQAAALRIALTRFRDWHKSAGDDGHFTPRDPVAYMKIIAYHQIHDIKDTI